MSCSSVFYHGFVRVTNNNNNNNLYLYDYNYLLTVLHNVRKIRTKGKSININYDC